MPTLIQLKSLLLLISLNGGIYFSFAQTQDISQIIEKARMENTIMGNQSPVLKFIPPKTPYRKISGPAISMQTLSYSQAEVQAMPGVNCIDSSFRKRFEAQGRVYTFLCSARTKDGGMLIGGFGRNQSEGPPYYWYATITKFDSVGNHIWSRELRSDAQTTLYIESMSELSDGTILITGWHENLSSGSSSAADIDLFVSKLTSTGGLIWFKTFHSLLNVSCSISNVRFVSIAEGANGDIYLAATIANCPLPKYLLVFKINSAGVLQWNYSFASPQYDEFCMGIFYDGDHITVINRSFLSAYDGNVPVDLLKLNSVSGAYISHKGWKVDLPYPQNFYAGFLNWAPRAIRLNNGNYCVYGPLFGDFVASYMNTDEPHFGVLEFDNNYDFIKGYTIHSSLSSNTSESNIKVDRFGRVIYITTTWIDYLNKTKYLGSADNGIIMNQRKIPYSNWEFFYDNLELFDDGSYVYIHDMATPGQDNFYLDYFRLHNSDTGSVCLGLRDNFSHVESLSYVPYDFTWANISPNAIIPGNDHNTSITPIVYTAPPPCFEKTWCDTVSIHGNPSSCDLQDMFTFSCYKNKECGSSVKWSIDPSVVQFFQSVNDTTVQVKFNKEWQGWLRAEIPASCGLIKDSLFITASASPGMVNIGSDTVLCPGNTILLNARRGYASYKWNDGSADSLLIVSSPGKYYIDVKDACNHSFTDTVIVFPSPPIPFDLGLDRSKCNNDTLHLSAPSGFINYSWGPQYNINTLTSQQVIVNPAIDTLYFVKAEKTPGCFAFDTIRIEVNQSPPIHLGANKSFCAGDSAILDAGAGFIQYQWSNGISSQQTIVKSAGTYSIVAATADGCKSYDTLWVLNVYPNPVVSLDHRTSICTGDTRVLDAGAFTSYAWNDGSTSRMFSVSDTGIYYVHVIDNNGCKGGDTTMVTTLLPLPAGFLSQDTAICSYGSLRLMPLQNFKSYLWTTGESSSSISISRPGIYWLQVTDNNDCKGRDTIIVNLKECMKGLYVPTAFTPNHDGKNDEFKALLFGNIKFFELTVYNRWGEVVFRTNDRLQGWDGRVAGIEQNTAVFVWICRYQLEGDKENIERGTVTLIR